MQLVLAREFLEYHGGARQRHEEANDRGARHRSAHDEGNEAACHQCGQQHLTDAAGNEATPHAPQILERELESRRKQEQRDADLGHDVDVFL